MGFFSWITQDTNESIPNKYVLEHFPVVYPNLSTFTVYMSDNKGNKWKEDNYEGYGVFGGKDYYQLLAEMNGKTNREDGITLAFSSDSTILYPNLNTHESSEWRNEEPENCPNQGYFYEMEIEEDDDYEEEDGDLDYEYKY